MSVLQYRSPVLFNLVSLMCYAMLLRTLLFFAVGRGAHCPQTIEPWKMGQVQSASTYRAGRTLEAAPPLKEVLTQKFKKHLELRPWEKWDARRYWKGDNARSRDATVSLWWLDRSPRLPGTVPFLGAAEKQEGKKNALAGLWAELALPIPKGGPIVHRCAAQSKSSLPGGERTWSVEHWNWNCGWFPKPSERRLWRFFSP